jgi:hypothetical protein
MNNKKVNAVHVWKKPQEGRAEARPYKAQTTTTRNKEVDAKLVWKQMEDLLAPQLNFSLADRVIYSHLFRHSRLEGKLQIQFSIAWLARSVGLSSKFTRDTVRRLIARGVLHLVECNCRSQHVVRVRVPLEVKGVCAEKIAAHRPAPPPRAVINIEEADFLEKQILRQAIHEREGGRCFYLFAPDHPPQDVPRPRCAASGVRPQFLSQPGVLLFGMQLAKRGAICRRASARALPRAPLERRRTHRPPPRPRRPRRRQTHPATSGSGR